MFKTQEEFLDRVKDSLTFKEVLDFEKAYNFYFKEVENDRFWFVDNPKFKETVGNVDFIFFCPDARMKLETAEMWNRFYTNIIPEKSKVRIKWRLPDFWELTHILNAFIYKNFYFGEDITKLVKEFEQKLRYWNGREYWTHEIMSYTKTWDNKSVKRMKCGKVFCGIKSEAKSEVDIFVKIADTEIVETHPCYGILIGEIVENDCKRY